MVYTSRFHLTGASAFSLRLLKTVKFVIIECVWYCGSCCGYDLKKIVFIKSTFSYVIKAFYHTWPFQLRLHLFQRWNIKERFKSKILKIDCLIIQSMSIKCILKKQWRVCVCVCVCIIGIPCISWPSILASKGI
jgi:hypothetical protein